MNKLKFHLINYKDILSSLNIVGGNLDEYLNGGRQDVLENFDIFCEIFYIRFFVIYKIKSS